ncbi:LamG-like jellyroll fold domain-containing protein [Priestia abyssalis]|uniref:LamG-like jellyroll fold domain-containing protein n=1 Tax=Priestia abyssalis TaxID=1221450 RepID=UPI001475B921|nr:LamG-like jellyroll fold domain-containing protein [Priestia abyssalis]
MKAIGLMNAKKSISIIALIFLLVSTLSLHAFASSDSSGMKDLFTYTENRDSEKPYFPDDAKLTVKDVNEYSATITFDQAKDNELVHSYRIAARDKATNKVKKELLAFSEFYRDPVPNQLTLSVSGLDQKTQYEITVYAIDSFNNESEKPLSISVETKEEVIDPNVEVPKADVFDFSFLDKTMKDFSPSNLEGSLKGNANIQYDETLKKEVLQLKGENDNFGYIPFGNVEKAKAANSFTLETVFSMNKIRNQGILMNTQGGGIGFESTNSGYVELWAHIGGSYQKVGVQMEANKTYHLLATYDGEKVTLYLDGKRVNSKAASGKVNHPDIHFAIGADPGSNGSGGIVLDGQVALARLYSKPLTASEVLAAYNEFYNRTQIEEVNSLHNELVQVNETLSSDISIGNDIGQYPQHTYDVLLTAQKEAKKIYKKMNITKEEAVNAYNQLKEAHELFIKSKIQIDKDKEALIKAIKEAKELVSSAVVGSETGQFSQASIDRLSRTIKLAETLLESEALTQEQLDLTEQVVKDVIEIFAESVTKKVMEEGSYKAVYNPVNGDIVVYKNDVKLFQVDHQEDYGKLRSLFIVDDMPFVVIEHKTHDFAVIGQVKKDEKAVEMAGYFKKDAVYEAETLNKQYVARHDQKKKHIYVYDQNNKLVLHANGGSKENLKGIMSTDENVYVFVEDNKKGLIVLGKKHPKQTHAKELTTIEFK